MSTWWRKLKLCEQTIACKCLRTCPIQAEKDGQSILNGTTLNFLRFQNWLGTSSISPISILTLYLSLRSPVMNNVPLLSPTHMHSSLRSHSAEPSPLSGRVLFGFSTTNLVRTQSATPSFTPRHVQNLSLRLFQRRQSNNKLPSPATVRHGELYVYEVFWVFKVLAVTYASVRLWSNVVVWN